METMERTRELFEAAREGQADRLKDMLTADPALANAENADGLTLLGFAAHFGRTVAVQAVLDAGAEVNALSHSVISYIPSNTALHAAIAGERELDVIRLLLRRGADPRIADSNGHTPLHTAAFHDDNEDIVRLLLEQGAEVNARGGGGETALALAVQRGNDSVAEMLRRHGGQL
ncbi:hypothetical protein J31TS4_44190 [Paenibacillus sp. J31TS4]|uniref:ankyrin repeat domain-containing protein n=1 Tax=Paenibacillus sp. J31TS4 TaxID=2807195 RepID=UPI001B0FE440|nr:ankyrin repeat domain-containing protein [Paenibacillus sp. J31TS4]GIP41139.1 hypothetical protein J31TS4_44190 [Paenibacillus sp. J31TS4]